MDASKVTAQYDPNRWTEAELNAWIEKNASPDVQGEAQLRHGLYNWVWTATRGLSKAAAQHIHADVHQRVDDEIEQLNRQGIGAAQALKQAIAALGNLQLAAKAYAQVFLTASEANRVKQISGITTVGTLWTVLWVGWIVFLFNVPIDKHNLWYAFLSTYIVTDSLKGVYGRILKRKSARVLSDFRWFDGIVFIAMALSLAWGPWPIKNGFSPYIQAIVGMVFLLAACFVTIARDRETVGLIRKLENGAV